MAGKPGEGLVRDEAARAAAAVRGTEEHLPAVCAAGESDEAVEARQAASLCEDAINRQRNLEVLDAEIDAFNNLIAAQCS